MVERGSEHAARGAYIEAAETFALLAEHGAVVGGYVGILHEHAHKFFLFQPEAVEIEPQQERGLWLDHAHAGDVALHIVGGEGDVGLNVFHHLVEPLLACGVGGFCSYGAEHHGCGEFVDFHPVVEIAPQPLALHHHPRAHEAGDVECLAGGAEHHTHSTRVVADREKGYVRTAVQHEVAVYLIAHHHGAGFAAQSRNAPQRGLVPLYTYGVVGIAQYHHARALAAQHIGEAVEIHRVSLAIE